MLTALSVARECHIIENESKVIVAHATLSEDDSNPIVQWVYVDEQQKTLEQSATDQKVGFYNFWRKDKFSRVARQMVNFYRLRIEKFP